MLERFLKEEVKGIPPYVPGRSKEDIAREYSLEEDRIIKLASNENPLGPSPKAIEEAKKSLEKISIYPDPLADELREVISDYIGLDKDMVIVGNGSDEIMELAFKTFLNPGEEVVIPIPTFSLYESLTKIYSGTPVLVPLVEDFQFDCDRILENINEKTKLVFICSPNNPTGSVISEKELRKLLNEDVVVVLDEAYVEFADRTYVDLTNEHENLIVLRTFSKVFGLAGMRAGYGVANKEIIDYLFRVKPPFNVNIIAQKAAVGALMDRKYLDDSKTTTKKGREFLFNELSNIKQIKVYPSKANFLLIRLLGEKNSTEVTERLFKEGVITRDCRHFKGLNDVFIRVSVGTPGENRRFLECFREAVG
ncbi:MAG: histidinol-phosphate transaminase [Candidatus Hydrothermarchaeales archaeon]